MNRREFMRMGMVVSALPLLPLNAIAASNSSQVLTGTLLLDVRYEGTASLASRSAMRVHAVTGDITAFWYEHLHGQWERQKEVLTGLTGYGAMLCLEQLARDHGWRLVYQGEHRQVAGGCIEHHLQGPASMLRSAAAVETAEDWMPHIAALLGRPTPSGSRVESRIISRTPMPASFDEPLHSWMLAPRATGTSES